jgi:hypothetical protein
MKKLSLLIAICATASLHAQLAGTIPVTFKVDMKLETVSPNGVHLYGSVQGYNPSTTLMTNTGNAIYEVTLVLDTSTEFYYAFVNGNTLGEVEVVPTPCNTGLAGLREFTSGNSGTQTLGPFCYESCDPCPVLDYNITFVVDMSQETISGNGVHIAGTWNSFSASADAMTHAGGGIYTHTESLTENTTVEYVFVNGNTSGDFETVPGPCNVNSHRSLLVPGSVTTLPEVCFGSCVDCVVGIGDVTKNDLVIRPTLATDYITLDVTDLGDFTYYVVDQNGREVTSGMVAQTDQVVLGTVDYSSGMYTVIVRDEHVTRIGRVIVQ